MKISKKKMDLKDSLNKEWIITNGIGGFCCSTIIGANTRRYHGLLIASLKPPAQRFLVLSKINESVSVGGKSYPLYTDICKNYVSDGYKYLESFEKEILPVYTYKVSDVKIEKTIAMVYGKNSVVVQYKVKTGKKDAKLTLAPIVNFRDFHHMTPNHNFVLKSKVEKNGKVKLIVDGNTKNPIYMYCAGAKYEKHENDIFRNMTYLKEAERGFESEEDLLVPGTYELEIKAHSEEIYTFVASLEDDVEQIDSQKVINDEIKRINNFVKSTKLLVNKKRYTTKEKEYNEFIQNLLISSDTFIVNRPSFGTHSVIAGFPWFLDWGRDTLIAFEGLFLITKRFDLAKEILITFTKDIKSGLVPNGYSESDNKPLYNSADSSLLLFEQVNKYLSYTKDYDFIKKKIYNILADIIDNYKDGINLDNNNIYIDSDGLLSSGTEETQNTWMDAKVNGRAITPRNGKVVELNALWYNALKTMENLSNKFGKSKKAVSFGEEAEKHQKVFVEKFYNKSKKCLYDVIGDDKIRPNQLFAISTTYPVIKPSSDIGKNILKTAKTKLLTKYGLRSLAKGEDGYIPLYRGGPVERDKAYHQGVIWVWLIGLYYDALKNVVNEEKDRLDKERYIIEEEKLLQSVYDTFREELEKDGLNTISELYDSTAPYRAGGTFSQAWSVSEILRIMVKK